MYITVLCKVVDNFGDIGVAWRFCRRLAKIQSKFKINLIVDDLEAFSKIENRLPRRLAAPRNDDATVIATQSVAKGKQSTYTIDSPDLAKYLGKPDFDESQIKAAKVPGTAIGLAWTSMGGDTLLLEAVSFAGKGALVLTGQMGDVMKESSQIAFNWARKYAIQKEIKDTKWFEDNIVHLHIPEGATPRTARVQVSQWQQPLFHF